MHSVCSHHHKHYMLMINYTLIPSYLPCCLYFISSSKMLKCLLPFVGEAGSWKVNVKMSVRPSKSTGVLFALTANNTVPLSIAVVTKGPNEAVSAVTQNFKTLKNCLCLISLCKAHLVQQLISNNLDFKTCLEYYFT